MKDVCATPGCHRKTHGTKTYCTACANHARAEKQRAEGLKCYVCGKLPSAGNPIIKKTMTCHSDNNFLRKHPEMSREDLKKLRSEQAQEKARKEAKKGDLKMCRWCHEPIQPGDANNRGALHRGECNSEYSMWSRHNTARRKSGHPPLTPDEWRLTRLPDQHTLSAYQSWVKARRKRIARNQTKPTRNR